ncbi:MAG: phosphatidylserine decarboxylase [Halioglobus sp.]|nr:phosphatidylserine decarboxylase [Halioglobus sp.]
MERIFILIQYYSPHHLLSRCTAWLADLKSPKWLISKVIKLFVRVFDVNMEEAAEPDCGRYDSFNAFFTRALREDARPLADADLVCPADGVISQVGDIRANLLLQAKGRLYTTTELLGGDGERAAAFYGGRFATIYLSPRDYHRVHMPLDGRLTATTYIPGRLFSVNGVTARHVDRLFARNERLVCYFDTQAGPMAMVLVGAMIVAGIDTVWGGRSVPPPRRPVTLDFTEPPDAVALERGQEMGRFRLGSTVILLFPENAVSWSERYVAGTPTRLGEELGDLLGGD